MFVCFFSRFSPCIGVITTAEVTPTAKWTEVYFFCKGKIIHGNIWANYFSTLTLSWSVSMKKTLYSLYYSSKLVCKGWKTDEIPLDVLVNVPAIVVDISAKCEKDPLATLESSDLEEMSLKSLFWSIVIGRLSPIPSSYWLKNWQIAQHYWGLGSNPWWHSWSMSCASQVTPKINNMDTLPIFSFEPCKTLNCNRSIYIISQIRMGSILLLRPG